MDSNTIYKEKTSISSYNEPLISATWYYFTSNGASETAQGNWWYYDTDGTTIIENVVEVVE